MLCSSRRCYSLISSLPVLSFLGRGSALSEAAAGIVLGKRRGIFGRLEAVPGISDVDVLTDRLERLPDNLKGIGAGSSLGSAEGLIALSLIVN